MIGFRGMVLKISTAGSLSSSGLVGLMVRAYHVPPPVGTTVVNEEYSPGPMVVVNQPPLGKDVTVDTEEQAPGFSCMMMIGSGGAT